MNILDSLLIMLITITFVGTIVLVGMSFAENEGAFGMLCILPLGLFLTAFEFLPFVVLDRASGSTIGIITSVDKNFFGTTALYIKTTETTEEKYCIEFNDELEKEAKELIGKKVKITYGTRIGFYSTGKCSEAPVDTIEEIE